MRRHITLLVENKGERTGMKEARRQAAWYIKGINGAASFRNRFGTMETISDLNALIEEILKRQ